MTTLADLFRKLTIINLAKINFMEEQVEFTPPIRVFIADPHQIVLKGLEDSINLHPNMDVVGTTTDGDTAFKFIQKQSPDIVILDVGLKTLSGIELIRQCRLSASKIATHSPKFLVFTTYGDKHYIWSYLAAGAQGYILKKEPIEAVVQGVEALYNNETVLSQVIQTELLKMIASINHGLTNREITILELVARGLSNGEIATSLELAEGTIQMNLQSIYRKIPLVGDRAGAVAWAWINRLVHIE